MTSANSTELILFEQTDFDTPPQASDTGDILRFTSEDFAANQETQISNEIRADGQASDVVRTNLEASGTLGFELSRDTYDKIFEGLLLADAAIGTEDAVITSDITVSFAEDPDTITLGTGSWTTQPSVGEWIKVAGSLNGQNDGYFRVQASTTTTITVDGSRLVAETAGESITITQGASLVNGTTLKYFGVQRENKDITGDKFARFQSHLVQTLQLTVPTNGLITGTFGFVGKDEQPASATWGDGSPNAATTTPIFNSVVHLHALIENEVLVEIVEGGMNVNNAIAARLRAGALGAVSIRKGRFEIGANFSAYLADRTRISRFINQNDTSLALIFEHADGTGYVFDLPRGRLTQGNTPTPGVNQDVVENIEFGAFMHETLQKTMRISKFTS